MLLVKNTLSAPPRFHNQHYTDYGKQRKQKNLHIYTNFKVCMAKFRELYKDGSPLQFISTAFFRAVTCFFELPVSEKNHSLETTC